MVVLTTIKELPFACVRGGHKTTCGVLEVSDTCVFCIVLSCLFIARVHMHRGVAMPAFSFPDVNSGSCSPRHVAMFITLEATGIGFWIHTNWSQFQNICSQYMYRPT